LSRSIRTALLAGLLMLLAATCQGAADGADDAALAFDDAPLSDLIQHPAWFKHSFLDLRTDLEEAVAAGKFGLAVYFGQRRCPYCRQLMEINFKTDDIVHYTREHFDVVAVDVWSPEELTTIDGRTVTQREYAIEMGTNFTPSLVFFDRDGKVALRLRGYYPPYQFRAALEYVAGGHYQRESFAVYMARGDQTLRFEKGDLVEEDFFSKPPYILDRSRFRAERPLVVFFEQGDCHACDILHTQPLRQPELRNLFEQLVSVQLDIHDNIPVITPAGRATTARDWARQLELFYAPTIVFFDEQGQEIIRVDSVAHFFRLRNVLNYVLTRGYLTYPDFQSWRRAGGGHSQ
jgi:thioredoxin-related protein